ncbi:TetR/AcrR family transcriptional regulator [Halomonas sp. I1]|uniref:TetR/AcrR family transcriptional regulator n=1 Tax=Halomonas sp. I1 TaxID=393536 RepID=UPI0028DD5F8B|nr:TetR/AcrR family transcriptional regulator [Halomonas sp. I1]MDT8894418.1 TetR/AcrR family transcriptional regulator [Halomonas sp. I1]
MDIRTRLISTAEQLFDRHGFTATGMDRLTKGAGISSRTLYKHTGSKHGLMAAVLNERGRRFLRQMDVDSVDELFVSLETWLVQEGSRGCLFLRAWGETGGDIPEIAATIMEHKRRLRERVNEIVAAEIGYRDDELAEEIVILFEGATHTAIYRGTAGVASARRAARYLMTVERKA